MSREEITRLLKKYYSATSTEEEEELLRQYLSDDKASGEFYAEKKIFDYYKIMKLCVPEPSKDFQERIFTELNKSDNASDNTSWRRIRLYISGIAAGLVILIGSYFLLIYQSQPEDTFSDSAVAYAESMKILYEVSSRLNKCIKIIEPVERLQTVTLKSVNAIVEPALKAEEKLQQLQNKIELLEKDHEDTENTENQ